MSYHEHLDFYPVPERRIDPPDEIEPDEAEVENRLQGRADKLAELALKGDAQAMQAILEDHREDDMPDLMFEALSGVMQSVTAWRDSKGFGCSLFSPEERLREMVAGIENALKPLARNAVEIEREAVEAEVIDYMQQPLSSDQ